MDRLLIVTGDDFGRSPGTNEAIEGCHRNGVLTAASLMVSEPAASDAIERARALPTLDVGLHLVLCDGLAASPMSAIPDLVDGSGRFRSSPALAGVGYWLRRRRIRDQLDREIAAQLEAFLETGLALTHVDGHHHLHMHPVLFDLLLARLQGLGVESLRLMREDGLGRPGRFAPRAEIVPLIFCALARRHQPRLWEAGIAAPLRVYGLRASGALDESWLVALCLRLSAENVEIYAHPSTDSESGRREARALCSEAVRAAIEGAGYRLGRLARAREPAVSTGTASGTAK